MQGRRAGRSGCLTVGMRGGVVIFGSGGGMGELCMLQEA